ncbi:MAG: Uncharacterized protein CEN92_7 [Candidatus Berkelbacteria bacterium Licking1014_96]|uniref:bAvd-like domain-containing protein n=1 Tax=Candidatus Berkelbacteria bacterium Licking1014_96 TaxID=2017149 RepID=A0A554LI59_9BACT|nr:MAG: Uncharacterized protein CEN92_7 [Candidatus Berkelbacteria bacterium Licking1014_96]
MAQLNFHKSIATVPKVKLKILQKLIDTYKLWQGFVRHFPKTSRYSLAIKIDSCFLKIIENIFSASYADINQKLNFVLMASRKLDLLKFFLQIAWEIKAIDNKRYIQLSQKLDEIGRMIGNWQKNLTKLPNK